MSEWAVVVLVLGVAFIAAGGPVVLIWVSNAAQRITARAAVELMEEEDAGEPGIGWLPGNER